MLNCAPDYPFCVLCFVYEPRVSYSFSFMIMAYIIVPIYTAWHLGRVDKRLLCVVRFVVKFEMKHIPYFDLSTIYRLQLMWFIRS